MMSDFDRLMDDLKQARDEIKLKLHLASMDARDEWDDLEQKWAEFSAKADVSRSAEGVSGALDNLGEDLKQAYVRFRNALND